MPTSSSLFLSISLVLSAAILLLATNTVPLAAVLGVPRISKAFSYFSTPNTTSSQSNTSMSNVKFVSRPSQERGNADHDWLKTFHTFSFASYHDRNHESFGSLRVINEDRVKAGTGFGTHSHAEFEIFSYVVAGQLEHKDSMGNTEILKRGDLQLTSAGTGISHSEKAYGSKQVHFLQIWSLPSKRKLSPKYFTRHFTDAQKKDKFLPIVAPVDAEGVSLEREVTDDSPAPVQSPLSLFASLISPSVALTHTLMPGPHKERKAYVHVVQTSGYNAKAASGATVRLTGGNGVELELKEGDGAYVYGASGQDLKVENVGGKVAEVLLFDLE